MSCLELVSAGVITIIVAVGAFEEHGDDLTPVEQAHRDYQESVIDEQELEHRLAFHIDDRNEEIRAIVEQVNNVGEETSKDIAREFESLNELRRADREGLTAIHGVTESTVDAVLERLQE